MTGGNFKLSFMLDVPHETTDQMLRAVKSIYTDLQEHSEQGLFSYSESLVFIPG